MAQFEVDVLVQDTIVVEASSEEDVPDEARKRGYVAVAAVRPCGRECDC